MPFLNFQKVTEHIFGLWKTVYKNDKDEFLIANLIKETLEGAGYSCKCLYDGESAADEIEHTTYDLILLDVMLPKINGFELISYIRQYEIPVIFITARAVGSENRRFLGRKRFEKQKIRWQKRLTFC